jgi:hypothetical protein
MIVHYVFIIFIIFIMAIMLISIIFLGSATCHCQHIVGCLPVEFVLNGAIFISNHFHYSHNSCMAV